VNDLIEDLNYRPGTPIQEGIKNFIEWYREFYKV
jgi:UDP-glucuronate 4-epimerase